MVQSRRLSIVNYNDSLYPSNPIHSLDFFVQFLSFLVFIFILCSASSQMRIFSLFFSLTLKRQRDSERKRGWTKRRSSLRAFLFLHGDDSGRAHLSRVSRGHAPKRRWGLNYPKEASITGARARPPPKSCPPLRKSVFMNHLKILSA